MGGRGSNVRWVRVYAHKIFSFNLKRVRMYLHGENALPLHSLATAKRLHSKLEVTRQVAAHQIVLARA